MNDTASLAASLFTETFGSRPTGVWAAPGRVNLIGEHTDYNNGLVLPIALPQRTYAAVRLREDQCLRLVSAGFDGVEKIALDDISPGRPSNWARYPAGVLWALRLAGLGDTGMDVAFSSDVPVGAGLSSSAAIEAAIAAATSDLLGLGLLSDDLGRRKLAKLCQQAENEIALAPTGGMDQAASLRCQNGHALALNCADGSARQIRFDLTGAGLVLLVIDSRAEHALGDGQYGLRRADCAQACQELAIDSLRHLTTQQLKTTLPRLSGERLRRRVRHVVTEIDRVTRAIAALELNDFAELGRLFNRSHQSLRDDYEVSCPQLDLAQQQALRSGALGARMTGGGFGGSVIAIVDAAATAKLEQDITAAFADAGFANQPRFLTAVPSGPAVCATH
jgi:galactokinase